MSTLLSTMTLSQIVERILISVGKSTFLKLYPILKNNIKIEPNEVCKLISDYKNYTPASQKTRLGHARRIINEGWEREALENISLSDKLNSEDIELALEYLKKL